MFKKIIISLGLKGSYKWAYRQMRKGKIITPMKESRLKLRLYRDMLQYTFDIEDDFDPVPFTWHFYEDQDVFSIDENAMWKLYQGIPTIRIRVVSTSTVSTNFKTPPPTGPWSTSSTAKNSPPKKF